jgi:hypothetical protein
MTTIFTNRRDGRAGHSTVHFEFAIAATATLRLQLCKYGCSRADQTVYVHAKNS